MTEKNDAPEIVTDVAGAAARVKADAGPDAARPGRPRKAAKGSRAEYLRQYRARRRAEEEQEESQEYVPVEVTDAEVKMYAALGATVWGIAGGIMGYRKLNNEEALELGAAIAPVAKKHLGFLNRWGDEITLTMTVLDLAARTKQPKPVSSEVELSEGSGGEHDSDRAGTEGLGENHARP